jgi:hypothetical protein
MMNFTIFYCKMAILSTSLIESFRSSLFQKACRRRHASPRIPINRNLTFWLNSYTLICRGENNHNEIQARLDEILVKAEDEIKSASIIRSKADFIA